MPTPTKGTRLGGGPAHQRLILANLATALFEHDKITTTEAKAKRLRPVAERLVTFAKRGDLHARRKVLTIVRDKGVVHRLFTEIAPDVAQRPGGYTRITKIGPRKGDNAPMAVIELVREAFSPKQATVKEAEGAAKRAAKAAPSTEAPATEAPATEAPATEAPATEAPATEAPATESSGTDSLAQETDAPAMLDEADEAPEVASDDVPDSDDVPEVSSDDAPESTDEKA